MYAKEPGARAPPHQKKEAYFISNLCISFCFHQNFYEVGATLFHFTNVILRVLKFFLKCSQPRKQCSRKVALAGRVQALLPILHRFWQKLRQTSPSVDGAQVLGL